MKYGLWLVRDISSRPRRRAAFPRRCRYRVYLDERLYVFSVVPSDIRTARKRPRRCRGLSKNQSQEKSSLSHQGIEGDHKHTCFMHVKTYTIHLTGSFR